MILFRMTNDDFFFVFVFVLVLFLLVLEWVGLVVVELVKCGSFPLIFPQPYYPVNTQNSKSLEIGRPATSVENLNLTIKTVVS